MWALQEERSKGVLSCAGSGAQYVLNKTTANKRMNKWYGEWVEEIEWDIKCI